jgi:molybdopterin-guanine dinucleotide biosynthesis protein A
MNQELSGIILAGGRSRRFGENKAFASWQSGTLIEAVVDSIKPLTAEILIVAKDAGAYAVLSKGKVRVVQDGHDDFHALGGIATALSRIRTRWAFVCACDMPFIRPALVQALWAARGGYQGVIPVLDGFAQPLCALYSREMLDTFRGMKDTGHLRLRSLTGLESVRSLREDEVRAVDPEGVSFVDIDTPQDLVGAEAIASDAQGGARATVHA